MYYRHIEQIQEPLTRESFNNIYGAIFEAIPTGVLIVDCSGEILFTNSQMQEMWGFTGEMDTEEIRRAAQSLTINPHLFRKRVAEILQNQETVHQEDIYLKDGRVFSRNAKPFVLNGRYQGYLWTYRDTTEKQRTLDLLESIFDHSPIGMAISKKHGSMIQVNKSWADTIGYSREELINTKFSNYTHPDDLAESQKIIHSLTHGPDNTATIEKRYIRKDKAVIDASIHILKLPNRNNQEAFFLGQIIDLTERKKAEQALFQHQKLESIGVLAGGVAHDFNNLLVAINAQASLALSKIDKGLGVKENIEKIKSAADGAAYLTEQLLAYSGQRQFKEEQIDLNQQIEKNIGILNIAIPKNVLLTTDLNPKLPLISAEKGQIQQILLNLIINSAESFENEEGTIHIKTENVDIRVGAPLMDEEFILEPATLGSHVAFSIIDSGQGMDDETKAKIFDPFFTTKFTGRGLGLAAVLGIIRGHKGALQVQSKPKVGTTFTLYFPVLPAGKTTSSANQTTSTNFAPLEPNKYTGKPILLIDDDEVVRDSMLDICEFGGIELLCAHNGREGIQKLAQHKDEVALILLDLSMPGLSSPETFTALKKIKPDLPIVLCSGYSEAEVSGSFSGKEYSEFISKPFDVDKLLDTIQKYTDQA